MPAGRPTLYKEEYCEMLERHMAEGLSFESFAALCSCHWDTLYEWVKVHPKFSEAKKRGTALSLIMWERMGIHGTVGEIKNFNSGTWIFNMKNRFKWRDQNQPDQSAPFEYEEPDSLKYDSKES